MKHFLFIAVLFLAFPLTLFAKVNFLKSKIFILNKNLQLMKKYRIKFGPYILKPEINFKDKWIK